MKDATFSETSDGTKYRKGDDWAERIACSVADVIGLPVAPVELAVDRKHAEPTFGTICLSVLQKRESLINGDELLGEHGLHVSRQHRSDYTVAATLEALEGVKPPESDEDLTAQMVFLGYLTLDALIGNTDRHEENWCVIRMDNPDSPGRRLSPTFDHASSLGFMLNDEDRAIRLTSRDQNQTPEGYADRAKTPFASKIHPISILEEAGKLDCAYNVDYWLNRIKNVDDLVLPIWAIPKHRMSTPAREFAERVMRRNWAKMTE